MAATVTPTYDPTNYLGSPLDPQVTRLYDNIQAEVPAVGFPMVQMQVWNTIEDFYVRSTCRRELAYWQMPPGVASVGFNPFDAEWLVAWVLTYTGLARGRVLPHSATLVDLECFPATTRKGVALLALKPISFSVELSPMLWTQWFETILAGVRYRLYMQPAKPYSSPQLAQFYGRQYTGGIATARAFADHEFTDGGGRWLYPYFSRGQRKN